MNALEVLYAPTLWRFAAVEPCAPVVRYADHCAEVEKLKAELAQKEQLRANAVARCEFLLAELHQTARAHEIITTGRWDGPAKVL